ncbi:putative nitric-oxide synthase [Encephalitozoon hellem ATCC 50504]|uniref:Nitric-oxide synthase n=1 Tax=Encephalitozoon hellem TaxID=27973 RepID=A0A9Q9C7Z3_ENCHE|nr:putative nitric-oxide synthase [Encephalitozoon hellem ATCC 50504]AFM98238.1 putative nitric-oxide synthase [Encephalitozoon hellem ATCC 50504]UTX43115.1 nitric-oxide synthase [Encephalitozoon hellem]|eukprot:XP_003887219.1 putative nitric-oxide synthase [Encephalitozoon hellem ATCC 50504]
MVPILYGSQTGTSIYVSKLIERAILHGYDAKTIYNLENFSSSQDQGGTSLVMEMDLFDIEKIIDTDFIIFVCSTHGDGTEPFNMSKFWSFLSNNDLPNTILSHLNFAVFGLGDSSYEKFNYCSKRLFNRLKMLGGKPILRRGSGDSQDREGFLSDLRPWLLELVTCMKNYKIKHISLISPGPEEYSSRLVRRRLLTPEDHFQKIVELVFDIPEYRRFSPGDCLSFLPENYNYREFMRYNGIEEEDVDGVSSTWLVKRVIDFNAQPCQPFFFALGYFLDRRADVEEEILLKVEEIAQDYDLYYDYIVRPRRTIFEVLEDLKVRVDITFLKRFCPTLYPRFFSVTKKEGLYHITVSIVRYKTLLAQPRKGVCSEYLMGISLNDTVRVGVGRSNLYFDSDKLLFICTGTGIALPRACVHEFKDKEIIIFYGFRNRDKDFLYSDEWNGENVRMIPAASRDDKVYVQDIFRKSPVAGIDQYLIFVSGNSRLNRVVRELLQDVYGKAIVFQSETW